jgi:hypothetical protein
MAGPIDAAGRTLPVDVAKQQYSGSHIEILAQEAWDPATILRT